jgi:two-component system OmpR family response regulator
MAGRVLLVQEDDDQRKVLAYILRAAGYDPISAISAEDGLALLDDGRCDLAVLDLQLPCMDGLEALSAIVAKRPTFPVIMVTASADVREADVRARGARGLLRKPFPSAEFLDAIRAGLVSDGATPRPGP